MTSEDKHTVQQKFINHDAEQSIEWAKQFITIIRNLRASINVAPSVKLPMVFVHSSLSMVGKQNLLDNQFLIKISY